MTKRSLTDMLRAETQKAAVEPEVKTTSTAKASATKRATVAHAKPAAKGSATTTESSSDLTDLVDRLKSDLEASRDRESKLQQQVTDLQSELKASQAQISQLKEYLEQADRLKAELDEAKKDNLKLAEANIKLTEEANASAAQRPQLEVRSAEPASAAPTSAPVPQPEPKLDPAQEKAAHLSRILSRPIGSNTALSKVNDKNIGWFD
jgi:chromosome segregation ATPase